MKKFILFTTLCLCTLVSYSQVGLFLSYERIDGGGHDLTGFVEVQKRVDCDRKLDLMDAEIALYVGAAYGFAVGEKVNGTYPTEHQARVFLKGYKQSFGFKNFLLGALMEYEILNEEFRAGIPMMIRMSNHIQLKIDLLATVAKFSEPGNLNDNVGELEAIRPTIRAGLSFNL